MITVNDINFKGLRALVRVDFNVPLNDKNEVTDTTRIDAALPTILKILKDGGSVVLMSHLGRPKQKFQSVRLGAEEKFSLEHILPVLEEKLELEIDFVDDCCSEEAFKKSKSLQKGQVLLLENLRFYYDEKEGLEDFADMLSQHGHIYVNDAFGTAHRAHASTFVIAQFFKAEDKCMGLLMAAEVENASKVLNNAERPFTAILGGAKVSDKITILENLMEKADNILIGGGMAYTFFKALDKSIGNSLVENDKIDLAKDIIAKAKTKGINLMIPVDNVIADNFANDANIKKTTNQNIADGWMALDIGAKTIAAYENVIMQSKTILWNGPMGVFEMENFQVGTKSVALAVAEATQKGAFSLIGGGDSVSAIKKFNLEDKVSYVSTGGGAMLEFFEGKELPGVAALES